MTTAPLGFGDLPAIEERKVSIAQFRARSATSISGWNISFRLYL
jgi:hypothetical protein